MNKWLAGNGMRCPDCGGSGLGQARDALEYESGRIRVFYDKCPNCNGDGRIALPIEVVLAEGRLAAVGAPRRGEPQSD